MSKQAWEIVEEEIEKMRDEHLADAVASRSGVLQGHPFGTALIFLKDRINRRIAKECIS